MFLILCLLSGKRTKLRQFKRDGNSSFMKTVNLSVSSDASSSTSKTVQPLARNQAPERQPCPDFVLEVTTHHAVKFKAILESLKAVLTECLLTFHQDTGLRMTAVDSKGRCAAFLSLDPEYFDFYNCEGTQTVGVDVGILHKLIKTPKSNDSLSFFVRRDAREKLIIAVENKTSHNRAKHELTLIHIDDQYELKRSFDFPHTPAMIESSYFQTVCRNLHSVGETDIAIKDFGNRIVFQGIRSETKSEYEMGVFSDEDNESNLLQEPLKGHFELRYLLSFSRSANNLSRRVRILLAEQGYLIIEYTLGHDTTCRNSLKYILFQPDDI